MIRVLLILIEMRYKCKTSAGGGRERERVALREKVLCFACPEPSTHRDTGSSVKVNAKSS